MTTEINIEKTFIQPLREAIAKLMKEDVEKFIASEKEKLNLLMQQYVEAIKIDIERANTEDDAMVININVSLKK